MDWYIGTEWKLECKGLRKKVLDLEFQKVEKPHQIAKTVIQIDDVLNLGNRTSEYLGNADLVGMEQELIMGTALTPVDFYVEMLVQQMVLGEKARCFIKTAHAQQPEIEFTIALKHILESKAIFELNKREVYELALKYKTNGVAMYKRYPKIAHAYFSKAAKHLISIQKIENGLHEDCGDDGITDEEIQKLFTQVQTNLAACLLNENRFEDVIYQTNFVESPSSSLLPQQLTEKSIYRRAMAFFHMKEFAKAQSTIELVGNYQEKTEFSKLHQSIMKDWKTSQEDYKHLVQRMFSDINKN